MIRPPLAALADAFAHPGAAFRGKPFWCWNGWLDEAELRRQVRLFKEMGMGGFFMHSRTGLKTEYLGETWFDCINACADEAERLGLEAWLYDEDRWPSGSAGGIATENPRHRMKVLRLAIAEPEALTWPEQGRFVAAFAARLDGLAFTEAMRIDRGSPVPCDGRKILIFTTETWSGHSFYNGNTYLDTLSREATEAFLQSTHERYRERCGSRLGRSIQGIFTDEPHHGTVMCENNENRAMADQRWTVPWTETLWDEFQRAWGYDLRERLPELFLFPEGRRISPVKWQTMELLQRMFLQNWASPIHHWCQRHGLRLTGHLLHEDSLVAQAVACGSVMRAYEYLDIPGVDVLGLHNRSFWIVKQVTSVARQFGRKWVLSELYGCTGWQLDFAGHRRIGIWQAVLGVNVRCHHLAWMTMEGEAKRDYPASIHFQSAWWRQYALVEDYFSRLHVLLQQGDAVCDILVINPIESTWAQIHPGWARWLEALDPELKSLEAAYRAVFTWLSGAHLDFDYGDEDHLARLGKIEPGKDGPLLRLGRTTYRVVLMAGAVTVRKSTLRLLEDFISAGGTAVFAGPLPAYLEALPSEAPRQLAARSITVPLEEIPLVDCLRRASRYPLRIFTPNPADGKDLLCQVRRDLDRQIVAVVNTSEREMRPAVELRLDGPGAVEEWDCASGQRFHQAAENHDGTTHWITDFPPGAERLFVVTPSATTPLRARPRFRPSAALVMEGPFSYELDEPNVCVLDFAEYRLGEESWRPRERVLMIDETVRTALGFAGRSGIMLQPWAAAKLPRRAKPGKRLHLRFHFEIDVLPEVCLDLLIERPHEFRVAVNGLALGIPDEPGWFIDPCFRRIPIPFGALRAGRNELELATEFAEESELEAVYLLGAFGVVLTGSGPTLAQLPALLAPGDITRQGLPFYSGRITYHIPVPLEVKNRGSLRFDAGSVGGAVAQVRAPGRDGGTLLPWPPYEAEVTDLARKQDELWFDVWLTRRNTFGPLHLTPLDQSVVGPVSFRVMDGSRTPDYVLQPSGLLEPPRFLWEAPEENTPQPM